jgi:hypothetical protein
MQETTGIKATERLWAEAIREFIIQKPEEIWNAEYRMQLAAA